MDLSSLDFNDEAQTLVLINPKTGEELADSEGNLMSFSVVGLEHERVVKFRTDSRAKYKGKKLSQGQEDQIELGLMASCVTACNSIFVDGGYLANDFVEVKGFFKKHVWAKRQLAEFLDEDSRFLGNSGSD